MDERGRIILASLATIGLFLLVQLGALALVEPFQQEGFQPVDDPTDPTISIVYVGFILIATAAMLAVFKYGGEWVIHLTILLVAGFISWYVFVVLLPVEPTVGGTPLLPLLGALIVMAGLYFYPEWYVIDGAGVVMGAGAAGLFGIGFGQLPALVLLVVLAVYDAISVYGTEHMLTLAEGVMEMKVPVLLVIPTSRAFSFRELGADAASEETESDAEQADNAGEANDRQTGDDEPSEDDGSIEEDTQDGQPADAEEGPLSRDALFIGLGDAVIPTILVASAGVFLDAPSLVSGLALNVPALGAMIGTLVGLVILLRMVFAGRAHAGLPLLNTGAIVGYFLAAFAVGIPFTTALGL